MITNYKKTKVHRFYVPEKDEETIEELHKILHREGSNLSRFIREEAERYVCLHRPGNPQQTLPTILKFGKPYRALTCDFKDGRTASVKAFDKRNKIIRIFCSFHARIIDDCPANWNVLEQFPENKTEGGI